jgi:glutaredoxin 3
VVIADSAAATRKIPIMTSERVIMYTTNWCSYCERARKLLTRKNVPFEEIDVDGAPERRAEMIERSGRRTVPQIFIGATHVGGSDELIALEAEGKLDALLAGGETS